MTTPNRPTRLDDKFNAALIAVALAALLATGLGAFDGAALGRDGAFAAAPAAAATLAATPVATAPVLLAAR